MCVPLLAVSFPSLRASAACALPPQHLASAVRGSIHACAVVSLPRQGLLLILSFALPCGVLPIPSPCSAACTPDAGGGSPDGDARRYPVQGAHASLFTCIQVCVCVRARTSCACTCVCADAKLATDGQHNLACPCSNLLFSVSCLFSRPFSFSRALCLSLSLFLSLSLSLFLSFFLSLSLSLVLFLRSRPADRALQTRRL